MKPIINPLIMYVIDYLFDKIDQMNDEEEDK